MLWLDDVGSEKPTASPVKARPMVSGLRVAESGGGCCCSVAYSGTLYVVVIGSRTFDLSTEGANPMASEPEESGLGLEMSSAEILCLFFASWPFLRRLKQQYMRTARKMAPKTPATMAATAFLPRPPTMLSSPSECGIVDDFSPGTAGGTAVEDELMSDEDVAEVAL